MDTVKSLLKGFFGFGIVLVILSIPFAWLTHVIVCIKTGLWGFLIAGAVLAPIGVIHGWGMWFNFW